MMPLNPALPVQRTAGRYPDSEIAAHALKRPSRTPGAEKRKKRASAKAKGSTRPSPPDDHGNLSKGPIVDPSWFAGYPDPDGTAKRVQKLLDREFRKKPAK